MKNQIRASKWCTAAVFIAATHSLIAADPVPIHWTATATTASMPLTKGSKVVATVKATIAPGWHLYAFEQQPGGPMPTNLSLVAGQPFITDGNVKESDPKTEFDSNFNLPTRLFEGSAVFTIPTSTSNPPVGATPRIKIDVAFQTCNDRMCLPLTVIHLSALVVARRAH